MGPKPSTRFELVTSPLPRGCNYHCATRAMTSASTALDLVVILSIDRMGCKIRTLEDLHEGHLTSQIDVLVFEVVTPTDEDE